MNTPWRTTSQAIEILGSEQEFELFLVWYESIPLVQYNNGQQDLFRIEDVESFVNGTAPRLESRYVEKTSANPTQNQSTIEPNSYYGKTVLYRHFDKNGVLLYVGISRNPFHRLSKHKSDSSWHDEITTITLEHFDTRSEAERFEHEAIREEKPIHNIQK